MKEILLVGAGGFIGAALRYIANTWFSQFTRFGFPLGTFAVNFIGCTLLSILWDWVWEKPQPCPCESLQPSAF
jgi:CrcB protein